MTKEARLYYIVAAVLLFITAFTSFLYSVFYTEYDGLAAREAEKYGVEKRLILAVIKAESGFNAGAVSEAGAVGLMQLMPETARWIYEEKLKQGTFKEEVLFSAETNVALGAWYLGYLTKKFGTSFGIIAYNAGEGVVAEWIKAGVTENDVPYPETATYYKKVVRYYKLYRYK